MQGKYTGMAIYGLETAWNMWVPQTLKDGNSTNTTGSMVIIPASLTYFLMFSFERERESRGGAGREGDTESEADSRLQAVITEPNTGLELTNCEIMTWDKIGCSTDWATQVPLRLLSALKQTWTNEIGTNGLGGPLFMLEMIETGWWEL